jgi:hypothetical protein
MAGMNRTLGCALTLMCLAVVLSACSSTTISSGGVRLPAMTSPEEAAHVYLRAALAGNCELTKELTLPGTYNWCSDPRLLNYRGVWKHPWFSPAQGSSPREECVPFEMYTHGFPDGTLPSGWQPWELCLVRTHNGWRLYDQGQA